MIFPDGPLWREQRKFMMRTLRDFGVGKRTMDEHIQEEMLICFRHLETLCEQVNFKVMFPGCVQYIAAQYYNVECPSKS